ncbi:MAG TPA: rubrerythrin family protein [Bryobacteraceae bacterium]|nr:rubrerythrin family protein [Bryobacteraceae bacterium]
MPTLKPIPVIAVALLILFCLGPFASATDIPNSETLQRLQTAYSAETNGFERYRAFADKADAEGYGAVATLFRAVSRAEQIQYTNLIDAIRMLGFAPQATVETPVVESTKDNLQTAINKADAFDRENLYPAYIKRAKAEGNPYAAKIFDNLKQGEAENSRLFKAALRSLDQMRRTGPGPGYYVCAATGYVVGTIDPMHCTGSDWELVK